MHGCCLNRSLKSIKSYLNTLEVKEVDLEEAIDDYIYTHDGRKRLALELDWKYCNSGGMTNIFQGHLRPYYFNCPVCGCKVIANWIINKGE